MPLEQDLLMEAIKDLREKVTETNRTANDIRNNLARMEVEQAKADAKLNILAGQYDALKARVEVITNDFYAYKQNQKGHEEERVKAEKQMASRVTITATVISVGVALAGLLINLL